jgi:hypothetical protein
MKEIWKEIIHKTSILMKSITFLSLALFFTSIFNGFSQQDTPVVLSSVNEIGIRVDSISELSTVDWDDLFSLFEMNQATDSICVFFELGKFDTKTQEGSNITFNDLKISVKGIAGNQEKLKEEMKTAVKKTEILIASIRDRKN